MRILLIEPYYSGSHKVWADGYKKYSHHTVDLLTLEGRHWKWRMHGAAIEIAHLMNQKYPQAPLPDLILVSDMLDLTTLKSLLKAELQSIPIAFYFHENQLSYPYSDNDTDSKRVRDFHYGFINYTSALAADQVYFNSKSQMDSFFEALSDLLKRMPDYNGLHTVDSLLAKTSVLPLGIEYNHQFETLSKDMDTPIILWTHRWEYDKNPDDFFDAMITLSEEGYDFKLAVLGAKSPKPPKIFKTALEKLEKHIVAFGKPDTYDEYIDWLKAAHILPVTSMHETFGISLMEAMHNGVHPLLPNRLSYPELISPDAYPEYYYKNHEDFVQSLRDYLADFPVTCDNSLNQVASQYDWINMHKVYDTTFSKLIQVD